MAGSAVEGPAASSGRGAAVLFVSLPSSLGGSTRSLATVLGELDGHCRRVLATPATSSLARDAARHGLCDDLVPIPGVDTSRWSRPVAAARIARWALQHRGLVAAVHANGLAELNVAAPAAALCRAPLFVWAHDGALTTWSRRLVPWIGRASGATFLSVSPASGRLLRTELGVDPRRIVEVPNPVDPQAVLTHRSPPGPRLRVGYLGGPSALKGFDLLAPIAAELRGEDVELKVFADRPAHPSAAWDALLALHDPTVTVEPTVSDVRLAYRDCDVVLCPSRAESFGRVAFEARLNGIPTVASDLPALRDVVGDAGIFFPVGDHVAAAEAIRRLSRSPELRAHLSSQPGLDPGPHQPGVVGAQLAALYGLAPLS